MSFDDSEEREEGKARQCFLSVHSRRFASHLDQSTVQLCPSMDLVTLSFKQPTQSEPKPGSATPLWLHRSLTFQKLATCANDDDEDEATAAAMEGNASSSSPNTGTTSCIHATAWRPDGRWMAMVDAKARLTLLNVEALVKEANLSSSAVFSASSSSLASFPPSTIYKVAMAGNAIRLQMASSARVYALSWVHVGKWHPSLIQRDQDEDEEDDDVNVSYLFAKVRKRYADRSSMLLPPSEYFAQHNGGASNTTSSLLEHSQYGTTTTTSSNSVVPSAQTPLNIIVAALDDGQVECFLNGRYRITSGLQYYCPPEKRAPTRAKIACSNDLSHIIVAALPEDLSNDNRASAGLAIPSCFTLFSVPAFAESRFELQTLSTLYSSIMGHFYALPTLLTEVFESWKTSLKPLDMKIDGLSRLLRNYGLLPPPSPSVNAPAIIRQQLVRYILSGHTAGSADLSNAMDQFFTGVQMNDQLVLRLERSLTVAISNVESALRKTIAAAQALSLESDELRGLARASDELIPSIHAKQVQEQCQTLLVVMESALTCLVDARFRLRDWIAWLRSTGAQIKARGTAPNSVQRENAKKRRVPDETVRRILSFLQDDHAPEGSKAIPVSTSEALLGINFSRHWDSDEDTTDYGKNTLSFGVRPPSPKSVATPAFSKKFPTIPIAFRDAFSGAQNLFAEPATALKTRIRRLDFVLSEDDRIDSAMDITTRLGAGGLTLDAVTDGESAPTGFFNPQVDDDDGESAKYRQWAFSAHSTEKQISSGPNSVVTAVVVRAVPLPWRSISTTSKWDDMESESAGSMGFYLQTRFELPEGHKIHELVFRGNDGKSGLFNFHDGENGTGIESGQALLAVVSRFDEADQSFLRELWQIEYDECQWYRGELEQSYNDPHADVKVSFVEPDSAPSPVRLMATVAGDDDEEGVMYCRTREMGRFDSVTAASSTRLVVSGLRGVAAVTSNNADGAFLEVLDLDEDEEIEVEVDETDVSGMAEDDELMDE